MLLSSKQNPWKTKIHSGFSYNSPFLLKLLSPSPPPSPSYRSYFPTPTPTPTPTPCCFIWSFYKIFKIYVDIRNREKDCSYKTLITIITIQSTIDFNTWVPPPPHPSRPHIYLKTQEYHCAPYNIHIFCLCQQISVCHPFVIETRY